MIYLQWWTDKDVNNIPAAAGAENNAAHYFAAVQFMCRTVMKETFPLWLWQRSGRMDFVASCDMTCRLPFPQRVRSTFARAVWFCLLILLPLGKHLTAIHKPAKGSSGWILCYFHKKTKRGKKSSPKADICVQIRSQTVWGGSLKTQKQI